MTPDERAAAEGIWLQYLARRMGGETKSLEQLCAEHPQLAEALQRCHEEWSRPTPPKDSEGRANERAELNALMLRLARPASRGRRYEIECDIGRGAMGVVQRVWDRDLRRQLAMKTMHAKVVGEWKQLAARFIEEAQIIAQLDHPSIVPVHDLGLDDFGRPFFVMKLVNGLQLSRVFEQAWEKRNDWNTARVLRCLLDVCEAVGYAHSKGVVHRDLKPSNIMVGARGEVFVMDWGVARVLGGAQRHRNTTGSHVVETLRSARAEDESGSIFTAHGQIVGTAAYMSPEQANGDIARVDARSDVYAVGAMLYHFLAKSPPYGTPSESSAEVLEQLRAGSPAPLRKRAPGAPADLITICERAMSRHPAQRYANLAECADDLRAFLDVRVVRARRGSRLARLGKWMRRRPGVAAVIALVATCGPWLAWSLAEGVQAKADIRELSELTVASELLDSFELLWPAVEAQRSELQVWLRSAERFESALGHYRRRLADLRATAVVTAADRRAERTMREDHARGVRYLEFLREQLEWLRGTGAPHTFDGSTVESLERQLQVDLPTVAQRVAAKSISYVLPNAEDHLLHDRLVAALGSYEELASHKFGGLSRIARVRRALAFLDQRARADHESESRLWRRACDSIADESECPLYKGLRIRPQEGLLPLGRNPVTGLWEFAHLQSGAPAQFDTSGRIEVNDETGVVLILIPGGDLWQGCQHESPDKLNYDPHAQFNEGPLVAVSLQPFFISKYELTQAQWQRWHGCNPSRDSNSARDPRAYESGLLPVDLVQWPEAQRFLEELGLALPTEAQWERAVRGDTSTPWANAQGPTDLHCFANLRDPAYAQSPGYNADFWWIQAPDASLQSDGHFWAAPVGSFAPSSWGLFDALGNVGEWTGDRGLTPFNNGRLVDTGERWFDAAIRQSGAVVVRGGSWASSALRARVMCREIQGERVRSADVGIRPARALDR